jgi:ribosomal protein S18 acetylase RimI-like enzyme
MDGPGIQIHPAGGDDRAGVLGLGARLAEGVAPWRDQAEALGAGRRWLEESLAAAKAEAGTVLVATAADGSVTGVISIRPSKHFTGELDGYIGELAVAEHASRQGIGAALIEAAETWATDHGLRNLTLHTGAFNTSARAFYAALGFTEEEVRLTRAIEPRPHQGGRNQSTPPQLAASRPAAAASRAVTSRDT